MIIGGQSNENTHSDKQTFISTRILSKKASKARKAIEQAFKGMKLPESERKEFVLRCLEILSRDLIDFDATNPTN